MNITTPGQALAQAICPTGYETLYPFQKEAYDAWAQAVLDWRGTAPDVETRNCRRCGVTMTKGAAIPTAQTDHGEGAWQGVAPMVEVWKCPKCGHSFQSEHPAQVKDGRPTPEPSKPSVEVPDVQTLVGIYYADGGTENPAMDAVRRAITTPYERKLEELRERIRIFGHNQKVSDAEHAKALTALRNEVSTWKSHTESVEKKLAQFSRFTPEDCNELMDVLHGATGRGCVTSARELVEKVDTLRAQNINLTSRLIVLDRQSVSPWVACSERMPAATDGYVIMRQTITNGFNQWMSFVDSIGWADNSTKTRKKLSDITFDHFLPIPPLPTADDKAKDIPAFVPFSTIPIKGRFEFQDAKWTKHGPNEASDGGGHTSPFSSKTPVIALPDEKPADRWAKEKAAFAEGKRVQARWTDWKVRGNDGEDAWWNMTTPPNWDTLGSIEYRVHPDDLTPLKSKTDMILDQMRPLIDTILREV